MKSISPLSIVKGATSHATWALYFGEQIPHPGNIILINKNTEKEESLPYYDGTNHIGGGIIRSYLFKGPFGTFI